MRGRLVWQKQCFAASRRRSAALAAFAAALSFLALVIGCDASGPGGAGEARAPETARSEFDVTMLEVEDPVERTRSFVDAVGNLELDEFPAVAAQLQAHDDEWAPYEVRLFMWAWSARDREGALRAALDWAPHLREATTYVVMRSWAREDPERAQLAARVAIEDASPAVGTSLTRGLAHGWSESGDYTGALDFVDQHFSSLSHRETLIEMLCRRLVEREGLPEAFAWAEALTERSDDKILLGTVFRKLARHAVMEDPAATVAWLTHFEGDPEYMTRARRAAAIAWGQVDPAAALDWTTSPAAADDPRLTAATERILSGWFDRDAQAVRDWLGLRPKDSSLQALEELVAELARRAEAPSRARERLPSESDVSPARAADPLR